MKKTAAKASNQKPAPQPKLTASQVTGAKPGVDRSGNLGKWLHKAKKK